MFSDDDNYYHGEYPRKRNGMATAAMVFGILSLVTCSVFYIAIPCGAMSILCGILSRTGKRMTGRGRAGLICGILGLTLSAAITVYAVYYVWHTPRLRSFVQQYMELYRSQLGLSPQELPFPWEEEQESPDETPDILGDLFSDGEDSDSGDSVSPDEDDAPDRDGVPYYDGGSAPFDYFFDYFYGAPSQPLQPSHELPGGEFI